MGMDKTEVEWFQIVLWQETFSRPYCIGTTGNFLNNMVNMERPLQIIIQVYAKKFNATYSLYDFVTQC